MNAPGNGAPKAAVTTPPRKSFASEFVAKDNNKAKTPKASAMKGSVKKSHHLTRALKTTAPRPPLIQVQYDAADRLTIRCGRKTLYAAVQRDTFRSSTRAEARPLTVPAPGTPSSSGASP